MSVSDQHAALSMVFHAALPQLLAKVGLDDLLPSIGALEVGDPTMLDVLPIEGAADALVVSRGPLKRFFIAEIQRAQDPQKSKRWLWYGAQAVLREQCDGYIFIIVTNQNLVAWARNIADNLQNMHTRYIVMDASSFSTDWSAERVQENVGAALFTLAIHGDQGAHSALAQLVWQEIKRLRKQDSFDPHRLDIYTRILVQSAPVAWSQYAMEHDMEYRTWFDEQMHRSKQQGVEQGIEKGIEKGLRALRKSLLELAALRNVVLCAQSTERIMTCADIDQLQTWFRVVATAEEGSLEL